jgi:hypothetical protein
MMMSTARMDSPCERLRGYFIAFLSALRSFQLLSFFCIFHFPANAEISSRRRSDSAKSLFARDLFALFEQVKDFGRRRFSSLAGIAWIIFQISGRIPSFDGIRHIHLPQLT